LVAGAMLGSLTNGFAFMVKIGAAAGCSGWKAGRLTEERLGAFNGIGSTTVYCLTRAVSCLVAQK